MEPIYILAVLGAIFSLVFLLGIAFAVGYGYGNESKESRKDVFFRSEKDSITTGSNPL